MVDCGAPVLARGWCKRHYDRWRRHGDPTICHKPVSTRGAPRHWLAEHVAHDGADCLIWPFALHPDGRAHMAGGKPARMMCELAHGPAPSPRHQAAHSCGRGNDACVHPRHLRWASPAENAADKEAHGTMLRGVAHYAAKLTPDQVRTIRRLNGSQTQREIAETLGVHFTCVNKVLTGRSWRHVT